jgi:hypothetical protein
MANIKFGTGQIKNPTPAGINLVVRIFTIAAGIFLGWMQTNNIINNHLQSILGSILGLLLALVNGIAPLFGIETTHEAVPKENVTAMTKPEP